LVGGYWLSDVISLRLKPRIMSENRYIFSKSGGETHPLNRCTPETPIFGH
jgi:hypothetical protein